MSGRGDDLELALMRHQWRLDALDQWRKDVEHRIDTLEDGVLSVTEAQKIANGVASELERRGVAQTVSLTWWQKAGAYVGGALILADSVRSLLGG